MGKLLDLAKQYLAIKDRKKYYTVTASIDDTIPEPQEFSDPFTDDEIELIRKYKEQDPEHFLSLLEQNEPDFYEGLTDGYIDVYDVDIDNPHYEYKLGTRTVEGNNVGPEYSLRISLTDDEYLEILTYCLRDKDFNYYKLEYENEELFNKLRNRIKWNFDYLEFRPDYPYIVTLKEWDQDVKKILGEKDPIGVQ